jgi:hypothetical protein
VADLIDLQAIKEKRDVTKIREAYLSVRLLCANGSDS